MNKMDEARLEYITKEIEKTIAHLAKDNLNLTIKGIVHLTINLYEGKDEKD